MRLGRRKPLTAAQQYVNLRANPLSSGDGVLRAGSFTWRFEASPSPLSRIYRVRIEMAQERSPRTFVETPDLALLADGRDLPHVYRNPTRLCLYLPGSSEWQPWMRIDQTIVPWSVLWLWYFEDWLASGEWKGGGVHPREHDQERSRPPKRRSETQ
ncbi:hypothetical protein HAP48_0049475 (plasmid) [Bradyrhizobium septentrionale]|uniref:Type II CBASS E2 protein domain-containing protein n=1 Tax=Bradyrhizobium septentrionale TaxID=1404411 RepID=A0A973W9Z2_9BRAD|nr:MULTISPECIES: hypothetical protein [Bradyrhizobium]MCK7664933.1 hypothetical protein [Bradyrhizobium sp. 2S1]UGY20990.1 hypothetical protein HAP48_0049475 [Bradyrhizobium septentrionale]